MIRLMFISADPLNVPRIDLLKEFNDIDSQLRLAGIRDEFEMEDPRVTSLAELQHAILEMEPNIVHFSGYGSNRGSLVFQHAEDTPEEVDPRVLSMLFGVLNSNIRCVVLSMCYSETQANGILEKIDCVVGLPREMSYEAANTFFRGFYQALGTGKTLNDAFEYGVANLEDLALDKKIRPIYKDRAAKDPMQVTLTSDRSLDPKITMVRNELGLGDIESKIIEVINRPSVKGLVTLKNRPDNRASLDMQDSVDQLRKEYVKFKEKRISSRDFYKKTYPIVKKLIKDTKEAELDSVNVSLMSLYDYMEEFIFLRDIGDESQASIMDKKISNGLASILRKLDGYYYIK